MEKYLFIAIGGSLGSIARYWVGSTISGRMGTRFPYGTFVINITACIIIGFALTYFGRHVEVSPTWRFLVPVGFVGAYSTFSTYEWETLSTLRSGAFLLAAALCCREPSFGLLAVWGGSVLAEVLRMRTLASAISTPRSRRSQDAPAVEMDRAGWGALGRAAAFLFCNEARA